MPSLHYLKIIAAIVIFLTTITAGLVPFLEKYKHKKNIDFPRGEALAAGVFLGAGLIHMLGDASNAFTQAHINYPFAFLICGASFLTLLLLEHLGTEIKDHKGQSNISIAILAIIMLSIHSLFAGTALGVSQNIGMAILIIIAILTHKWAASFALAIQINKSPMRFYISLILFLLFSLMTPIGILLGDLMTNISNDHLLVPISISIAAGTFLYIGTLHGLKRAVMIERCCNLPTFFYVILGFTLMALVAIWT